MTAKLKRIKQSAPKQNQEPPPVMGKNTLFVSEESVGHVENFYEPSDTDQEKKIRKIESQAPTVDPDEKWVGDASSDS